MVAVLSRHTLARLIMQQKLTDRGQGFYFPISAKPLKIMARCTGVNSQTFQLRRERENGEQLQDTWLTASIDFLAGQTQGTEHQGALQQGRWAGWQDCMCTHRGWLV